MLHYNKGWGEYFIPMDGVMYGRADKVGIGWKRNDRPQR
jgi:hypothetical protein